jgi:hypothetical protein
VQKADAARRLSGLFAQNEPTCPCTNVKTGAECYPLLHDASFLPPQARSYHNHRTNHRLPRGWDRLGPLLLCMTRAVPSVQPFMGPATFIEPTIRSRHIHRSCLCLLSCDSMSARDSSPGMPLSVRMERMVRFVVVIYLCISVLIPKPNFSMDEKALQNLRSC